MSRDDETTGSFGTHRRLRRTDLMTAESTSEERHEKWCASVDTHLDRLSDDVGELQKQGVELTTIKRMTGAMLPMMVVAAVGFVVTAYVAFDRLSRAQSELSEHVEASPLHAHPDLAEVVGPVRETQERILATIESVQREAARRDSEIQSRLDRMEARLDSSQRPR